MLLPVDEEKEVYSLLGVFLALRHLLPHLSSADLDSQGQGHDPMMKDSFGGKAKEIEVKVNPEQLLQVSFQFTVK